MPKKQTSTAPAAEDMGFGPSPHPFAATIDQEQKRREDERRAELRRQRKMTSPHHSSSNPHAPNLLAIPAAFKEWLDSRGLEGGWIRKDEWPEYQEKGYKLARHDEIARLTGDDGSLRHDYQQDAATSPTTAVERREMLLVYAPKSWKEDRLKVEQHLANAQMTEDPFDSFKSRRKAGEFGGQSRRPEAMVFNDPDEDDE